MNNADEREPRIIHCLAISNSVILTEVWATSRDTLTFLPSQTNKILNKTPPPYNILHSQSIITGTFSLFHRTGVHNFPFNKPGLRKSAFAERYLTTLNHHQNDLTRSYRDHNPFKNKMAHLRFKTGHNLR